AVVELDGALGELGLLVEGVPAEVDPPVAEVTDVFVAGSRDVLHESALQESNEQKDLGDPVLRDGVRSVEGGPAVGDGVEGVSRVVDVAREVDAGAGDDVSQEGELRDAPVLDLHVTEVVETGLVGVLEQTEGVEEAKRGLGTELVLESIEGGGDLASPRRSKGSGGGDGGGDDDRLHGDGFRIGLDDLKIVNPASGGSRSAARVAVGTSTRIESEGNNIKQHPST
ncbi:hypothetical protein ACHAWF_000556, partial [Thalassiosira exigua]